MLGRQKWIVLLAVIVVPLIAFVVSSSQRRLYQASVTVLVSEQNPTAAALNLTAATSSPPDRYATTQAAVARAGIVAQMAVRAAKVPGRTAGELLANSNVSAKPNADLLAFSVSDPVPAVAEKLAFAYATQFKVYRHRLDTETLAVALAEVRRRLNTIATSGATESPLFRSLTDSYRALQSLQTLQVAGASTLVLGPAGGASLVQPKTSRNLILGILVGLALGIGLAFLREALDTRVHSADELQARLGLPLLGHLPKPDRRLAQADGRAARAEPAGSANAGALRLLETNLDALRAWWRQRAPDTESELEPGPPQPEQLATLSEPTGPDAEAFRILRANLDIRLVWQDVGSILVTSMAQGEGKSTTAANLAVTVARSGRHVILVDLDLRHPGIDRFFDLGDRPGLTNVAEGEVDLVDALSAVDVRPSSSGTNAGVLEILTVGPTPSDPGEFLSSSFVPDALAALAARCDLLMIDTPPLLAVSDAMTIATRTDALILIAGVSQVRRATLAETRRVLETCPAFTLGFIATGSNGGGRYPYRAGRRPQRVADA
jgi:polysaccharide biosynthesis transport protein